MKRCPECNEVFDEQKAFCDIDGSALVEEKDFVRAASQTPQASTPMWVTGVIGGFIGIIVCVMLYIVFLAPNRENSQQDHRTSQNTQTPSNPNQIAVLPSNNQPRPVETASPTETESPEASPSPSASPAAPASTPVPAALNNGPVATGGKAAMTSGEHAIIKMKDGTSVEADAAWEDEQGVWFRRSGLVSFVEKSKVEAITEPPQKRPAAAEAKTP
jgi:cytoskeletal protein RodZ